MEIPEKTYAFKDISPGQINHHFESHSDWDASLILGQSHFRWDATPENLSKPKLSEHSPLKKKRTRL